MAEILNLRDWGVAPRIMPPEDRGLARHAGVRAMYKRWRTRRRLAAELAPQPDSVLADAGWTRVALDEELRKPFWQ